MSFRSEPPIYSESQIIAIIMAGESDTVSAAQKPEQKALGAISGLLIGQLKEQILGQLPLDVLKVDVAGEDYNLVSRTRIERGKYILENLDVGYSLNLGASGATRPRDRSRAFPRAASCTSRPSSPGARAGPCVS